MLMLLCYRVNVFLALLSNIFVHFFSRSWGKYWDRGTMFPLLVEKFIPTCWKGIITKKKSFRVLQKLSVHILYKLKVQTCPEIAAKTSWLFVFNILKTSETVKQHFQFLNWLKINFQKTLYWERKIGLHTADYMHHITRAYIYPHNLL